MAKQDENVTFWKKHYELFPLHLFFVIYDQIMSSLVTLSIYTLGYIQIPLKEFLDLPFNKELQWMISNSFLAKNIVKILGENY